MYRSGVSFAPTYHLAGLQGVRSGSNFGRSDGNVYLFSGRNWARDYYYPYRDENFRAGLHGQAVESGFYLPETTPKDYYAGSNPTSKAAS